MSYLVPHKKNRKQLGMDCGLHAEKTGLMNATIDYSNMKKRKNATVVRYGGRVVSAERIKSVAESRKKRRK
jgi:hypothetical protein